MEKTTVFLTDGTRFIGPYEVGDFAISRGIRTLRETFDATEVYSVKASTLEEARAMFQRDQQKRNQA